MVTPYWPQANGEAECFMHTIQKAVCGATYSSSRRPGFTKGFQSNKLSPPYCPEPFTVVHKKDYMVTVKWTNN